MAADRKPPPARPVTAPPPRRFLPSTASLRALETLDRLGSATAAANELNLSQSAVSRQLQTLEAQLGVALILRRGRRMVLTPEAAGYAAEIRMALQKITQATLKLTINPAGGSLDLAILPTFGMRWLVPRLPDFARRHPEVTINLSTRIKPFNFGTEPFDAAIHFGNRDWPGTGAVTLKTEAVVAVCAPDLLKGRAARAARDLLELPLLHIETRPDAWRAWFAAHGITAEIVTGTIYDQFSTITQAALHGLGVALLPDYLAEQDLATGRLVMAWGGPTRMPGAYQLVWPLEKAHDPALMTFRDWLATQAEDEDPLPR
ncbi:MAG: LysR family transcriptional regulator [Pseudomonadota bacterium]|uniref:LysR family transcriptional regulator n=1 Tax=Roseovarius TaxID=74030 RepID=UPI0022A728A3|nr:LysR family transcriptional regulator [Roseovarius sp. EGI FJ00037]MCZ0811099.1 LysR family transcriptional regulator [Roseovarius sp. EGI FJ00037]